MHLGCRKSDRHTRASLQMKVLPGLIRDNKKKRLAGLIVIGQREVSSPQMVNKALRERETHAESG